MIGGLVKSKKSKFYVATGELYSSVVVLCSGVFRNSGALQCLEDAASSAEVKIFGNEQLHKAFQDAWQARLDFCKHGHHPRRFPLRQSLTIPRSGFLPNSPR